MLKEAEENAEADKKERQKVEAKNQLEGYLYSLRNTLDDEGMKEKIVGDDREKLTTSVTAGSHGMTFPIPFFTLSYYPRLP